MSTAYRIVVTDAVPAEWSSTRRRSRPAGQLTGADPVTGGGTITWDAADLPGPLAPGATVDLRYEAVLAPSAQLTAAALANTATMPSYASLPTGGRVYTGAVGDGARSPRTSRPSGPRRRRSTRRPAYIGEPFTVAGHGHEHRRCHRPTAST